MPMKGRFLQTHYWTLALFLLFVFLSAFFNVTCPDAGFHIGTGRLALETGRIPSQNTFSSSMPDNYWILHQWWPGIFFYLSWLTRGITGLIFAKSMLAVALFYIVWLCCKIETKENLFASLLILSLAVVVARIRFFERPYMFSALFTILLIYGIRKWQANRRWHLLALPILFTVWANTHAGVIDGFAILGINWLTTLFEQNTSEKKRHLALVTAGIVLSVAASILSVTILNPSGAKTLFLPIIYVFDPFWRTIIAEFQMPFGTDLLLLSIYSGALLFLQIINIKHINLFYLLCALFFGFMSFRTQRVILPFIISTAPYAAGMLSRLLKNKKHAYLSTKQLASLTIIWLLLFVMVILPDKRFRFGKGLYAPFYPTEIYDFMRTNVPRQNIYNNMRYGGSLIWFLYPDFKPFIDGRCEAYTREFWKDVVAPLSVGTSEWENLFNKYALTGALVVNNFTQEKEPLVQDLAENTNWALVCFNDDTLLFLKRTSLNYEVISRYEYKYLSPYKTDLSWITQKNAAAVLQETRRATPFSLQSIYLKSVTARALLVSGKYGNAAALYLELLQKGIASSAYWRDYGYCLFMNGKTDAAKAVFKKILEEGSEKEYAGYMLNLINTQENVANE